MLAIPTIALTIAAATSLIAMVLPNRPVQFLMTTLLFQGMAFATLHVANIHSTERLGTYAVATSP